MSKFYPDISHYEPVNDWAKVKKNCPFIITKGTQGTTYIDSTLASVIKNCEKLKIPYWLYTYLNKGNELAQAKFLVETCKGRVGDYFIGYILDVEAGNAASGVQSALDYLKTTGKKLMLYTMYAEYDKYKNIIKARPDKCAWWEARFGLNNGKYSESYPCHMGVDFHQYTDKGSCPGIPGNLDLNRITGQGKKESWFTSPAEKSAKNTATKESTSTATEDELRQKPVVYLKKYIGIKEGSDEHKAILATFNNSGLCSRYKMTVNDAWCATAVSAAFIASGLSSAFPCVECSCKEMIAKAKKAGIWKEDDSYTPKVGDVIMYDWQDSGKGDDTGNPDHVGVIDSVAGDSFKVIEGNISDTVGYRNMNVNGKYIRGYITPEYSKAKNGGTTTSTNTTTATGGSKYMFEVGTVKKGSKGNDVKLLQRLLKSNGCNNKDGSVLSIDGDAGSNTVYAIKSYQKKKGLTVDGIAGSKTWKKILLR